MFYLLLLLFSLSANADTATEFLDAHNDWRIKVNSGQLENQPIPAPVIPLMEWVPELAEVAQEYAEACVFEHSNNRNGAGENLAMGHSSITHAVNAWAGEYRDYTYPAGFSGDTGHYTQVVWHNTTQLGCGYAPSCRMYVCRYREHGNFNNQPPYQIQSGVTIPNYTNDFTLSNVVLNGISHTLKMKDFILYDFYRSDHDYSKSTNYVSMLDGNYVLYVPFVYVNGVEYYAILGYTIDSMAFHLIEADTIK